MEEGGEVPIRDYQKMEKFIENWGRSLGYEVLMITRNINPKQGMLKDDNYHLDMFLGVLQGKYLVMPDAGLPYMTPESHDKLIDFFKPENIIFLDKAELKAHCAILLILAMWLSRPILAQNIYLNLQSMLAELFMQPLKVFQKKWKKRVFML